MEKETKKKRVVIALGGNALGKNLEEQRRDVKVSAKAIADLLEENCEVLVVHGNGPQVGLINNAFNEYYNNHKKDGGFPVPLAMAGAMSEAYIGYDLQNALQEEFANRNLKVNGVATLITQTEVDENDPAFKKPTKPIGQFMTKEQAEEKAKELGWEIVEDSGRGYRRVVASPIPVHIVEIDAIKAMFNAGSIVICAGGGGIPVFKRGNGHEGAPAVIDKDNAASLLARQINADLLIILTAVEKVSINFNKPDQKSLDKMTVAEAKKYSDEAPLTDLLPDINCALAWVQVKEYARNEKTRKELFAMFHQACLIGRHKMYAREMEEGSTMSCFPLILASSFKDVKQYASRKEIEVQLAYDNSVIADKFLIQYLKIIHRSDSSRA